MKIKNRVKKENIKIKKKIKIKNKRASEPPQASRNGTARNYPILTCAPLYCAKLCYTDLRSPILY